MQFSLIDRESVNKIESDDQNFQDLKTMVNSSKVVEVGTASEVPDVGKVVYKSEETVRKETTDALIKAGFTRAQAAEAAKDTIATIFDGFTTATTDGARVLVANGKDGTAGEPEEKLVEAMAHELYGHAAPLIQGKPWEHDDGGPVDANIIKIHARTKNNSKGLPTPANQQNKRPPE